MVIPASLIEKTPDVCGGDARIVGHRITVWQLIEARRLGFSDTMLLESHPTLQPTDLEAAWEYARRNPLEIERNIWENQAVMEERGGDARLALLVRGWQLGLSDIAIADSFTPPLAAAEVQAARRAYRASKEVFDQALPGVLPEELKKGLSVDGSTVR